VGALEDLVHGVARTVQGDPHQVEIVAADRAYGRPIVAVVELTLGLGPSVGAAGVVGPGSQSLVRGE